MTFTPAHARRLFAQSNGADPLFAPVDGANCDTARAGNPRDHSLILHNGLIRIAMAVPANAEFSIAAVNDPHGCALRVDPSTHLLTAAVYRRPLPSTNLSFLSGVMFDGRETIVPLDKEKTFAANLRADLADQAISATKGHAQATQAPSTAQVNAIVDFELAPFSGQIRDNEAGALDGHGATGGPMYRASQSYYPGVNDVLGADPHGVAFTPLSMHLYSAWATLAADEESDRRQARADVAAGEQLFNSAPLIISNVRGLNDSAALGKPASFGGTCTSCHDTPNVGDHSLPLPLDIGTSHVADPSLEADPFIAAAVGELSVPDLPLFLISGCPNPFTRGESESFYTTDPGRALVTGHCSDFNRVKGPILRGLAARAPFFHNGAAANLREVVEFYNQRFQMALTETQKRQLVAFLRTL